MPLADRDVVVGDVHGCLSALLELLAAVELRDADCLVALGDIVDRGPDSLGVWRFLRDRPNTVVLLGNHERAHAGGRGAAATRAQMGADYGPFVAWAAELPRYRRTARYLAVHGGFEPGVPLEEQREDVLTGAGSGRRHLQALGLAGWAAGYSEPVPIVFGHTPVGRTPRWVGPRSLGLDTGAGAGGALSAVVIPGFRITSVATR